MADRQDGRGWDQLRNVTIERGVVMHAEGSALIKTGNTHVLCAATVAQGVPGFLRDSGQGWVTGEYAMLPRATTQRTNRERRGAGGRTMEIQRIIGRSLRSVVDMPLLGERTITVDCDVLQADGGTRTAAISGAFVALSDAVSWLLEREEIARSPLNDQIAAISVGIVDGNPALDLCYVEDSSAEVDMNVVMTGSGKFVELQGTAEGDPFSWDQMNALMKLAEAGIGQLVEKQRLALS